MNFAMDIAHMDCDSFSSRGKCMIVISKHIFNLGTTKVRRDRGVYVWNMWNFLYKRRIMTRRSSSFRWVVFNVEIGCFTSYLAAVTHGRTISYI